MAVAGQEFTPSIQPKGNVWNFWLVQVKRQSSVSFLRFCRTDITNSRSSDFDSPSRSGLSTAPGLCFHLMFLPTCRVVIVFGCQRVWGATPGSRLVRWTTAHGPHGSIVDCEHSEKGSKKGKKNATKTICKPAVLRFINFLSGQRTGRLRQET